MDTTQNGGIVSDVDEAFLQSLDRAVDDLKTFLRHALALGKLMVDVHTGLAIRNIKLAQGLDHSSFSAHYEFLMDQLEAIEKFLAEYDEAIDEGDLGQPLSQIGSIEEQSQHF